MEEGENAGGVMKWTKGRRGKILQIYNDVLMLRVMLKGVREERGNGRGAEGKKVEQRVSMSTLRGVSSRRRESETTKCQVQALLDISRLSIAAHGPCHIHQRGEGKSGYDRAILDRP